MAKPPQGGVSCLASCCTKGGTGERGDIYLPASGQSFPSIISFNQTQWLLWCPGIWQMVPGQCPRLYSYTFQNCKHSQTNWRTTCSPDGGSGGTDPWTVKPCVPSVLQTQEAESCPPSSRPSPRSACRSLFLRCSTQPQTTAETCSATSPTALWLKELAFCSLSHNHHKDTQEPSFT